MSSGVCRFVSVNLVLVSTVKQIRLLYGQIMKYVISDVFLAVSWSEPRRLHLLATNPAHCTRRSIRWVSVGGSVQYRPRGRSSGRTASNGNK